MQTRRAGIDVVVVDYRSPRDLERFLLSVDPAAPNTPVSVYVGLVQPTPQDIEAATIIGEGVTDTVLFDSNVGFNRATNHLGAMGEREVIGCFNADVRLTPGSLDELYAATLKPEWGVVGPRQVDDHGRLTAGGIFGTEQRPKHRGWMSARKDAFVDVRDDAVYVAGSALFLRRDVWDELTDCEIHATMFPAEPGPWLPARHFYGDSYLSAHARAHGYRCVYFGTTTIHHKAHGAPDSVRFGQTHMAADRDLFRAALDAHGVVHE